MSYLAISKQNKLNAQKAEELDVLRQQQRDNQMYSTGADDAIQQRHMQAYETAIEQELMHRAEQAKMQRQIEEASRNQLFRNQGTTNYPREPRKTLSSPEGLAATIQQDMQKNAVTNAYIRAEREGNLSDDNINQLVEEELSKIRGL